MRAPFRSRVPLVVSIHDVAVLRHPETFNRWTRTYSARALPRVAQGGGRDRRRVAVRRRRGARAARRPRREAPRDPVRGRAAVRPGRAACGAASTCSRSRRSSRGRTCRGSSRASAGRGSTASSCASSAPRAGATCASTATASGGWRASTTTSSRGSTAAPRASPTSRSTRGSGCRCSRRWPAPRRSSPPPGRRSASSRTASRSRSTRSTRIRSPRACSGPLPRGKQLGRRAAGGRLQLGAGRPGACRPLPRARRVKPLVAIDADVLGRRRTGDETLRREPAARARAARRPRAPGGGHPPTRPRPGGNRARRAPGPQPDRADGVRAPRGPAPPPPRARALQLRHPAGLPRARGRDRPRPLVRAAARA